MHHCLADGAATMGYLSRVWAPTAAASPWGWIPEAVPSPLGLVCDAIIDHARYGIRRLPGLAATVVKNSRSRYRHYQQCGPESKPINPLITVLPKTRFNRALPVRRSVASVQLSMKKREYLTRAADDREQKGVVNLTVSNLPGPREVLSSSAGVVKSLRSVGVLSEGVELNITAWSYVDPLNITLLACDKAMPDLDRLARGFHHGLDELLKAVIAANNTSTTEPRVATGKG